MTVALDLIELDGKVTPEAIVGEILRQNPTIPIPVPIEDFARLAGVEQIRPLETEGFEGMLITNSEKTRADIFYNGKSMPQRKRFTIGHELGHLLIPHHKEATYECSKEDMTRQGTAANARERQEVEANRFSSELLMPKPYFKSRLKALGEPELAHVETLRKECDTSIEVTARRYVALSDYACAVVYAKDRTVRYAIKNEMLPYYMETKGGWPIPRDSASYDAGAGIGEWQEVDAGLWLRASKHQRFPSTLLEQTWWQDKGFKIVLLHVEAIPEDDEDA